MRYCCERRYYNREFRMWFAVLAHPLNYSKKPVKNRQIGDGRNLA